MHLSSKKILDFRTFLFLNLILMLFLILSGKQVIVITAFAIAAAVMMIAHEWRAASIAALWFIGSFALHYYTPFLYKRFSHSSVPLFFGTLAFLIQRIIPFLMLALTVRKTKNISEIAASLEKMKLHKGIILSIIVMIRYLPAMMEDIRTVREAMKLKGISLSPAYTLCHPVRTIEASVVPMLFKSLKTAEEFSSAALIKGYGCNAKRSSYFDVRIRRADTMLILGSSALLTAAYSFL